MTIEDGDITLYEDFFSRPFSDEIFKRLLKDINWEQNKIKVYNKVHLIPRLTAWYGNDNKYTYSNVVNLPKPWTEDLLLIKSKIEDEAGILFTNVLLNLYRTGQDGMGWHRDNEKEFGEKPVIASVSFGETRTFRLRHKYKKELPKITLLLKHGSLLIMKGNTQHFWEHEVPKTSRSTHPRINLTFRAINGK